ncbi:polymerase [Paenibacillus sp. CAA11]|uniref:O-antigen ligase family protein n=1 Tax=Paenibacillus sp. CAA11 TaxID=1532905 RepID=UPI000D35A345|nr:O-antigen ligase family protein [Paenibacillus sp. CAA11]AWB46187.1 polymerase [Paenibacillus sp. CAA11]
MSNPVYGKSIDTSRNHEKTPAMLWLLSIGIIVFLLWSPFQAALFNGQQLIFERPLYWALLASCLLMLLGIASLFKMFKLEDARDGLAFAVLLIPLTFVLSLISAASSYYALNQVLIQCIYAFLFIISIYLLRDRKANRIIETAIITVAYIIVMFGLLNWLGQTKFTGALVGWFTKTVVNGQYVQAVWIDANGPRLASVFQYPNTYAAFLMAFFFVSVFAITRSKKGYAQAIHAFMLVPMIVSLLLTLSRGGLVFLPIVFIVLLLFLKPAQQLLWACYSLISGIAALVISKPVTNIGQQFYQGTNTEPPVKGWIYVLAASAIVAVIIWLIQSYVAPRLESALDKWSRRKLSNLWLPLGSVVVVGVLAALFIGTSLRHILPGNIGERLETINLKQHSVLERFTFYKDALKVVKDYPVIGAGGGAWASLYEKYQNNPYSSRQAHSFLAQYLVEIGILGFIIFMAFILYIFYKYIRGYIQSDKEKRDSYFVYFILALSLLIHSTMDFNLSFVFIGMLVFLGLAGMAASMEAKPFAKINIKANTVRASLSIVLGIASIVLLVVAGRFIQANSDILKGQELMRSSTNYKEIKEPIDKGLSIRGSHPDAAIFETSLLLTAYRQTQNEEFYTEAHNLITKVLKKEPYNKDLYKQLISAYELKGEPAQAYQVLADNADKYAWDIEWYEKLISQSYDLGYQALGQGDSAKKEAYFKTGLAAYEHVVKGVAHIATLPPGQLQGRPFSLTPTIALNSGRMQFLNGDTKQAISTLKQGLTQDFSEATNQELATWYLAILKKTGSSDQTIYDQLIAASPTAKEQIERIAQIF